MAAITGTPYKIKDATLKIGANTYEGMVSAAEYVPASSQSKFKTISGLTVPIGGMSDWMLNITFAQDFAAATSLSRTLLEGEGTIVAVVLTPKAGGPTYVSNVTLVAGNIGGAADADAVSSVSMPSSKPILTP